MSGLSTSLPLPFPLLSLSAAPCTAPATRQSPRARPGASLQLTLWAPPAPHSQKALPKQPTTTCCPSSRGWCCPMARAGLSRGCILPGAVCRVVLHPTTAPRPHFLGCPVPQPGPISPPSCLCPSCLALPMHSQHNSVPGGLIPAPHQPPQAGMALGRLFPINPAGPGEGFSSFNGCSSSMYRALHTEAPGAGLAGGHPAPRAGLRPLLCLWHGAGSSSLRQHLPGTCRCRICACAHSACQGCPAGVEGAVLCAERAGWGWGCSPHRPGVGVGGSSRCLHPCPSPRPPRILAPELRGRGDSGLWLLSCPASPEGPSGGVR